MIIPRFKQHHKDPSLNVPFFSIGMSEPDSLTVSDSHYDNLGVDGTRTFYPLLRDSFCDES